MTENFMSDNIEFKWKIFKLEVMPQYEGLTNVIKRICFEVEGRCQETHELSALMGDTTLINPDKSSFIPFFELNEETVLKWVKSSIGTQTVFELEQEIRNNIAEIVKPKLLEMELPWVSNTEDKVITFKDKKLSLIHI